MIVKQPLYIVDELAAIVANVSTSLLTQLQAVNSTIEGVQYYYGHPKEIIDTLRQKDQSMNYRFAKYPAVCLFQDFSESEGRIIGVASDVRLHIIICYSTDQNYKASERYANSFKPILYPIYYALLNEIFKSGKVLASDKDSLPHTKIDRLYWGRTGLYGNEGNIFDDFLDAIEIQDLQLKFYQPLLCP